MKPRPYPAFFHLSSSASKIKKPMSKPGKPRAEKAADNIAMPIIMRLTTSQSPFTAALKI